MLEKLDRMEAWLVRIEQRMSAFEMRQSQFEGALARGRAEGAGTSVGRR